MHEIHIGTIVITRPKTQAVLWALAWFVGRPRWLTDRIFDFTTRYEDAS